MSSSKQMTAHLTRIAAVRTLNHSKIWALAVGIAKELGMRPRAKVGYDEIIDAEEELITRLGILTAKLTP